MKQIIPFSKEIQFNTNVYEVVSISLEHSLKVEEECKINGEFIINGEYKINDISVNKESFNFNIPFSIELDNKYNTENIKIDIDDFYYEVINENYLKVNIDVLIDGLEVKEEEGDKVENISFEDEIKEEEREEVIDLFEEVEPKVVPLEVEKKEEVVEKLKPILDTFDEKNETFVTYHVHIVRDNDNVDSICLKYNVSKEDLSNYNNINEIKIGDKLIVPAYKDEKD